MRLSYGRVYSVFDLKRKRFVYVGQTRNEWDFTPHGTVMSSLWARFPGRYMYIIEREWRGGLTAKELLKQEIRFIVRRNTWCHWNVHGLNFMLVFSGSRWDRDEHKRRMNTEEVKQFHRERMIKRMSEPGLLEVARTAGRQALRDPSTFQRYYARCHNPQAKAVRTAKMMATRANPEVHNTMVANIRAGIAAQSEDTIARIRAGGLKAVTNPINKAASSARTKLQNADPTFQAKVTATHRTPQVRASKSAKMTVVHANPEYKARLKEASKFGKDLGLCLKLTELLYAGGNIESWRYQSLAWQQGAAKAVTAR